MSRLSPYLLDRRSGGIEIAALDNVSIGGWRGFR
jgi:hypothetical protein